MVFADDAAQIAEGHIERLPMPQSSDERGLTTITSSVDGVTGQPF